MYHRRQPERDCVSNFYPIRLRPSDSGEVALRIRIFHCKVFDSVGDPIRAREDVELQRQVFDVPRQEGWRGQIEDALGVQHLVFGGDCAAGLLVGGGAGSPDIEALLAAPGAAAPAVPPGELLVDVPDCYEAWTGEAWRPAVVLATAAGPGPGGSGGGGGEEEVEVELYEPGSFFSDAAGPRARERVRVPAARVRPRQWIVRRGARLEVPSGQKLVLWRGQALHVEPRGPDRDEPSGRLVLGADASFKCKGGTVDNRGALECSWALQRSATRAAHYRVELHFITDFFVDSTGNVPNLPHEERAIALQCLTWIFERAFRRMGYRTLGGRGQYRVAEPQPLPKPSRSWVPDRQVPPKLWLYRGCQANAVQVACGPCLKVDASVRLVQNCTVLERYKTLRDLQKADHQRAGRPPPTQEELKELLQRKLGFRTCMTKYNNMHYRIRGVILDKSPLDTFPCEGREVSFLEYFQDRWNIKLDPNQPMLHTPSPKNDARYLPSEVAHLTGLDDDERRSDLGLEQMLMKELHKKPDFHWQEQGRFVADLAGQEEQGGALRDWGIGVSVEPLEVPCGELEHEPVYFKPEADRYFQQGREPPAQLAVATQHPDGRVGFVRKPWPDVWTDQPVLLERWVVFHAFWEEELATQFVQELRPLADELSRNGGDRLQIGRPEVVSLPGKNPRDWPAFLRSYQPPPAWLGGAGHFAVFLLPDEAPRGGQVYNDLKNLLTFESILGGTPTQMVRSSSLQQARARGNILKNVLQQILVKRGAWLWVPSPLRHAPRCVMVVGIDACKHEGSPALQTLCASLTQYFTTYHVAWRIRGEVTKRGVFLAPPGDLLREALEKFFALNDRLPDTLLVYRGGISESYEAAALAREVHDPEGGLIATVQAVARGRGWERPVRMAYILARRGTHARFKTRGDENVPSGTYVDKQVTVDRENPGQYDFYMVSQSFVNPAATAKPTLYSVLHSAGLDLSWEELRQLTYRLCALYMTFSGMVSTPAPLKYATKLLALLAVCRDVPSRPPSVDGDWRRSWLFFV